MNILEIIYKNRSDRRIAIPFDKMEYFCLEPTSDGCNLTIYTATAEHTQHWETEAEALDAYDQILNAMRKMK